MQVLDTIQHRPCELIVHQYYYVCFKKYPADVHTICAYTYIHTYIHTYMHTCIHRITCVYAGTQCVRKYEDSPFKNVKGKCNAYFSVPRTQIHKRCFIGLFK